MAKADQSRDKYQNAVTMEEKQAKNDEETHGQKKP